MNQPATVAKGGMSGQRVLVRKKKAAAGQSILAAS